jgi:glutamyl endopeptidase
MNKKVQESGSEQFEDEQLGAETGKTLQRVVIAQSTVPEEHIEDPFMGNPAESFPALGQGEAGDAPEDLDDHDSISSEESTLVEFSPMDGMAVGDIEAVPNYNSSLAEARLETEAPFDESKVLDAWYAEFGDPAVGAMILKQRQQPASESVLEVVIGKDDRVKINNTTAYPWRTICSLRITAADNTSWIGTGWLVGPRTVITAGHCVYMHSHGGWAKKIEVIPGRNGSTMPYGSCTATHFRSVKGWTNKKNITHDYGAIILPSNCRYGDRVGYFGYANLSFFSLLGLKVNLAGYPGDKPTGTIWFDARQITLVLARRLVYNIDTAGGQSGSPVWRLKDGKRHVVGIHTNGASTGNSATRITKPVFDNIKKWKAMGS